RSGATRVVTETGAGQWGSALAFATGMFDLKCKVYMVRASYDQKPYRRTLIETWGGSCVPSPSPETNCGRAFLEQDPNTPGSLGMAISEAVEVAATNDDTKYSLGSVLNHVLMHQTIIGLEAKEQLSDGGVEPDVIIGCVGGGSNFGGIALPFIPDRLDGKPIRFVAVEPASCPTLSRAPFGYDYGDTSKLTPLMAMHSLGHDFVPEPIHAGGLRYHGMAPIISQLVQDNLVEPMAVNQNESFKAGLLFAKTQGYVPAPETCHAIAAVIREAQKAKEENVARTILFSWSGHGLIDLSAYAAYMAGELQEHRLADSQIEKAANLLAEHPQP
ncbi:TrpB-like pyridoxal phosphate-dependent enzyme, partial [bacterium]|nr:TrpB-like pyridoxal phosphate-dependent enzyme [bacterium]